MRLRWQKFLAGPLSAAARAEGRIYRLWIAINVVVIFIGGGLWWRWLNLMPESPVPPSPPLPQPNAFETFQQSARLVTGNLADEEAVASNAPALALLRSGFAQPYRHPAARFTANGTTLPGADRFVVLADLLDKEGKVYEAKGKFRAAAQSRLDSIRLGILVPQGGDLLSGVTGVYFESVGRRALWGLVENLDARTARAAAEQIETLSARRVSSADNFLEEKRFLESGLMEDFRGHNTFQSWQNTVTEADSHLSRNRRFVTRAKTAASLTPLLKQSKSQILEEYSAYMDGIVARSRMPYAAATRLPEPPVPMNLITVCGTPNYPAAMNLCGTETPMECHLLIAALALRAYKLERNVYPENPEALVREGILKRFPVDPYSASGDAPLQYRRTENGKYLLYSIGPDGRDDGGKSMSTIPGNHRAAHSTASIHPNTLGDFVAGIDNYVAP